VRLSLLVAASIAATVLAMALPSKADDEQDDSSTPSKHSAIRGELTAGGGVRTLFGFGIDGWEAGGSLDYDWTNWTFYTRVGWFRGATAVGLRSDTVQVEGVIEWRPGRFRLGAGAQWVYFDLAALGPPGSLQATGAGLQLESRYDMLRLSGCELFLGARLDADLLDGRDYSGVTGLAGLRF
jgi:hypothetical protein